MILFVFRFLAEEVDRMLNEGMDRRQHVRFVRGKRRG